MNVFFISFSIFALVMLGMAVGVIVANRSIKGSCGGLNDIEGLSGACDICVGKKQCRRAQRQAQRQALQQGSEIEDRALAQTDE